MVCMRVLLICIGIFCSVFAIGQEQALWVFEQEFVKFGKKDVYEKMKKERLREEFGNFSVYAAQEADAMQYIYLVPVGDYAGLSDLMKKRTELEENLSAEQKLPFVSTLNFTITSLQRFLPACSYVPRGKESLSAFRHLYFYLFGIIPGNEAVFEAQLHRIAEEQGDSNGVCMRSWKILIGGDAPKYLIAIFGSNEKQVRKDAEELELIPPPLKNLLRSQKQGSAILRKDLSGA